MFSRSVLDRRFAFLALIIVYMLINPFDIININPVTSILDHIPSNMDSYLGYINSKHSLYIIILLIFFVCVVMGKSIFESIVLRYPVQCLFVLYHLIPLASFIGRLSRILGSFWGKSVGILIALSLVLAILFSALSLNYHMDPMKLDETVQNMSDYSVFVPTHEQQTLEWIRIFAIDSSFCRAFSEEGPFLKLLSNDTIYNYILNNDDNNKNIINDLKNNTLKEDLLIPFEEQTNFTNTFSRQPEFDAIVLPWIQNNLSLISKISSDREDFNDPKEFNITFNEVDNFRAAFAEHEVFKLLFDEFCTYQNCGSLKSDGALYNSACGNLGYSSDRERINEFINITFYNCSDEALKIAFKNARLSCYVSISSKDAKIRKKIIQLIYLESKDLFFKATSKDSIANCYINLSYTDKGAKGEILKLVKENTSLQQDVLAQIYNNGSMRNVAIKITLDDKHLQENLLGSKLTRARDNYYFYSAAFIWNFWQRLIFLWIILVSIQWFRKVGKGISIAEFTDDTSESGDKSKFALGLSSLLVVRLNRLNRLYLQVDEARQVCSVANTENRLGPAARVEEGDLSANIFTDDSKLTVGIFSIPGKFINSLIDQAVRRPKIYGSLHKVAENKEILTARMSAGGRTLSWRVDDQVQLLPVSNGSDPKDEIVNRTRDDMVTELACKIFTDLTFDKDKMVSWKATWHFTEGLRKYREQLNSKNKQMLEQSANGFQRALKEDKDYPWAHYNLAIVYIELANLLETEKTKKTKETNEASQNIYLNNAMQALCSSIGIYPQCWQSYYAMALVLSKFKNSDRNRIESNCENAIKYCSDYSGLARTYYLWGMNAEDVNEGKRFSGLASNYALLSLLKAEFHGEDIEQEKYLFNKCLQDLSTEKYDSIYKLTNKVYPYISKKDCPKQDDIYVATLDAAKYQLQKQDPKKARAELEIAALLDKHPQVDWEIPWLMARSYLKELSHATKDGQMNLLNHAHQKMREALSSCQDADMKVDADRENEIKCLANMGWICLLQGKYDEAISHLIIAKHIVKNEIEEDKSKDFIPCISVLLGLAYLKDKLYEQSQREFEEILAFKDLQDIDNYLIQTCCKKKKPNDVRIKFYRELDAKVNYFSEICIGIEGFEVTSKGLLYAVTNLYLVIQFIERDVVHAKAFALLNKLDILMNFITEDKRIIHSRVEHCWGWFYLQMGILAGSPEKASKTQEFSSDELNFKEIKLDKVSIVEGEISADISWKNEVAWLENAKICNSLLLESEVDGIYICEAIIKNAVIKKARIEKIEYENLIPELWTHFIGLTTEKHSHLTLNPKLAVLKDVEFMSATISSVKIQALTVDLAIEHLQKSLEYYANAHTYLHLARAYELQMQREKDPAKKAHLRQKALNACQHSLELDRFEEYTKHRQDLEKRLEESPTAISPTPGKEEKKGKAKAEETKESGPSSDADKKTG